MMRTVVLSTFFIVWGWSSVSLAQDPPPANPLGILLFRNVTLSGSYAYTNNGILSDPAAGQKVPFTFTPQNISEFSIKVDKPIIAHLLDYLDVVNDHRSTLWQLGILPIHFTGSATYGDTLTLHRNSSLRSDIKTKEAYSVGVSYTIDLASVMGRLPWFAPNAR